MLGIVSTCYKHHSALKKKKKKNIFQFNYSCNYIVASFNIFRKHKVFFIIKLNSCPKSSHCFSYTPVSLPSKERCSRWEVEQKGKKNTPKYTSASSKLIKVHIESAGKSLIYCSYRRNLNQTPKELIIFHSLRTENVPE